MQPAVLAVLVGLSVILGLLVYLELERREKFEGREAAAKMIEITNGMTGLELEPMETEVWRLGDWFYMRGFEGFAVPPEIASLQVVGSRVFKMDGSPIAQLAVETHNSIVYVFRPSEFRMQLEDGSDWRIFDHIGWVAALRRQGRQLHDDRVPRHEARNERDASGAEAATDREVGRKRKHQRAMTPRYILPTGTSLRRTTLERLC